MQTIIKFSIEYELQEEIRTNLSHFSREEINIAFIFICLFIGYIDIMRGYKTTRAFVFITMPPYLRDRRL